MKPTMKTAIAITLAAASVIPASAAMADTAQDNTNQSCSTPDSIDRDNTTLATACATLDDVLHGKDSTAKTVYVKASQSGQTAYTADSARKLVEAYDAAEQLWRKSGVTTDDVDAMNKAVSDLKTQAANMTVASWTVTDGGQTITLSAGKDSGGTTDKYTGTLTHKPTGDLQAVGSDGSKVNLTHDKGGDTATASKLYDQTDRTATYVAAASGSRPAFEVTAGWTDGKAVQAVLSDQLNADITQETDEKGNPTGFYLLSGTTALESDANNKDYGPAAIALTDGTQLTGMDWSAIQYTTAKDGSVTLKRTATNQVTVTDKSGKQTKVKLNLTAQRTQDSTARLTLTYTDKSGNQRSVDVSGYDKTKSDPVTLDKLPYSEMGDAFTLSATDGRDAETTISKQTVAADGTRSWTVTTTYTDASGAPQATRVTVTLPFDAPARQVTDTDARLAGLLVNGQPIAGWDADTLDYTIVAKGDEPYKVSPKAADGQTVAASDVTQGAGTTRQEWTVSKNGQTRVYSVTVIRKHDPTAAERFEPADPTDQDGKTPAPGPSVTDLKSYGYTIKDKDGNTQYKPFATDDHTIPEGGTFAYESYQNQVVTVKGGRTSGMTWRYTLTVLSPDNHVGIHTVDVTYLTAATHKAELTGIRFDGKDLNGFDPARHEYAVQVSDPARYTVMPVFDQSTGMTVSTHKADGKAVVTVTSADGQVKTVYTFDISQAPLPVLSGTQAGSLAQTGTVVGAIGAAALALVAVLAGCVAWLAGRRRKGEGGKDIVA
ncbi:cell surface protein [Bifidobacterium thermophilum]|uniref:hypothetical protein n=1 Tax=Bifidobacterium thermophilum TaxID=33905 RepID=UPI000C70DE64|nr:hypothetical protein [Bifidobacterium thermophilum]PKU90109.1 cell surface protein [Bifidobacterium thermophilum]